MFEDLSDHQKVLLEDPINLQQFLKEKLNEEPLPEVAPPTGGTMGSLFDERLRGQPCRHCNSAHDEEDMLVCDKCEATYHSSCAKEKNMVVHDGPFFCHRCRGTIAVEGVADVMEDYPLLDYLFTGVLPTDLEEIQRIKQLASLYRAHGNEVEVHIQDQLGRKTWVNVPPVLNREDIIKDTHETLGHIGRERLLGSLR